VGLDVAAYNEARLTLHTHLVRGGYLMLLPTTKRAGRCIPTSCEKWVFDVAAYNEARLTLHTHFVRSGYLML
jgi:hypothetical protein